MHLIDLDFENVREFMLQELELDITKDKICFSPILRKDSHQKYIDLLKTHILSGSPNTLASEIQSNQCMCIREPYRTKSRKLKDRLVPITAHQTLAEDDFNRFYMRGICLKALEIEKKIVVYRTKPVKYPRIEIFNLIGDLPDPSEFIEGWRAFPNSETLFELNSGLSVRIIMSI